MQLTTLQMNLKNKLTEFYLITGFLGTGKTTFLKNFIKSFNGKTIRLIINEFGKEGVDGKLLNEVGATLREISSGSIFCSCRLDKFEEALEESLSASPDVLIVEASGLSDPTNIRKILEQNEKDGRLIYRGCICLIDAVRLEKVFDTARVCKKQLNIGDLLLINKTDIATQEQIDHTRELILGCYPTALIQETSHGIFLWDWIAELDPYRRADSTDAQFPDITMQRAIIEVNSSLTSYELERFIAMFAEDTSRIKGFVYLNECGWLLANCVGSLVKLEPWGGNEPTIGGLNALATKGMAFRKSLKYASEFYNVKIKFG